MYTDKVNIILHQKIKVLASICILNLLYGIGKQRYQLNLWYM